MYERFDGQGFPGGLRRQGHSPRRAHLAPSPTPYADLDPEPAQPLPQDVCGRCEACEVFARYRGTVFDPNLVDMFKHTVTGEDLKARLLVQPPPRPRWSIRIRRRRRCSSSAHGGAGLRGACRRTAAEQAPSRSSKTGEIRDGGQRAGLRPDRATALSCSQEARKNELGQARSLGSS